MTIGGHAPLGRSLQAGGAPFWELGVGIHPVLPAGPGLGRPQALPGGKEPIPAEPRGTEQEGAMGHLLLLLLLGTVTMQGTCASRHSLRLLTMAVSEPGPGLPWHSTIIYVDDQLVFSYDSEQGRVEPRADWMAQHVSQEYWDEQTWRARRWQAWFQRSLSALRELHNHSGGFHIIQTMYGCDLREDNTTRGFYQDSYDGRDFLTFDKETMTWVAADIGAQITKRRFDADVSGKRRWKVYMEEECIQWLKSFLEYGKETLQRKVRPTVRVRGRSAHDGLRTLSCTVSGFYPRHITATWLRNGESREQDTYSAGPLPNGDGTYRTWVTMEIDPQTNAQYACRVEHESLLEPLSVPWEPDNHRIPAVAGGVTAALLVAMGIGAVVWKKKCSGKKGDGYAAAPAT